jgi:hypothetical protein
VITFGKEQDISEQRAVRRRRNGVDADRQQPGSPILLPKVAGCVQTHDARSIAAGAHARELGLDRAPVLASELLTEFHHYEAGRHLGKIDSAQNVEVVTFC